MTNTIDMIWDFLVEYGIATEEELQLVTGINGYSEETLNNIIYYRTGYSNYKQLTEEF